MCGETFVAAPWAEQGGARFCSRGCADRGLVRHDVSEPRPCAVCGEPILARPGEPPCNVARRQTCGDECRYVLIGRAKAIDLGPKFCVCCGVEFERREDESADSYRRRRTCNLSCGRRLSHLVRHGNQPRKGKYPAEFNRELCEAIRERDGRMCRVCGMGRGQRELSVHHIDYDKQNCDPSNLVTLCHACHMKTNVKRDRDTWRSIFTAMMAEEAAA